MKSNNVGLSDFLTKIYKSKFDILFRKIKKEAFSEKIEYFGFSFTNLLVLRIKMLEHGIWRKRCHSGSPAQLSTTLAVHTTT
jgi:hypothetical protein